MLDFHCRDMDLNCDQIVRGSTSDEVLKESEKHVSGFHKMKLSPEIREKMRFLIHDAESTLHRESIQKSS